MIGVLNDDLSICLKHENGTECETKLEEDYPSRIINGYFIKRRHGIWSHFILP